ncbi:MAG TPA: hypothetical protein VFW48_06165 [Solirubrobacterales bacterium]|nr:hypothetical protein [Solirubrobacterales bacterium]
MEAGIVKEAEPIGCGAFFQADAEPSSLRRFLVGSDEKPQPMDAAEIEEELNDPFAVELLRAGEFPSTGEDLLARLDAKVAADHPLASATQQSFVVAEESQVVKDPAAAADRRLRFLLTRGGGPDGPDLMISTSRPDSPSVEVMAWDGRKGGFNYYRTILGTAGSWVWAGNSRHAWEPGTRSSGPFESHPTGNLLFKELKLPWVHWHSPRATMDPLDVEAGDAVAQHPWFDKKLGAYVLEDSVAKPAITRWNRRRLAQVSEAAEIGEPVQVMERLLGSPEPRRFTVNLVSSQESQPALAGLAQVGLPSTFFADLDVLSGVFELTRPQVPFAVSAQVYRDALAEFGVTLRDREGPEPGADFERTGDTHFLFVVPERAFEDVDFVRQLVRPRPEAEERQLGLVSERLAACLLMVDFPNPVFSDRRAGLLGHVPSGPLPAGEWEAFSQSLGDAIVAAATGTAPSAAELEFAELWAAEEGWKEVANQRLGAYYERLAEKLATPEGFRGVFRLAEERRNRVRKMPINEAPMLFAQTSIPVESIEGLAMNPDGTVEQR